MKEEKILDMDNLENVSGGKEIYRGEDPENPPVDPPIDLNRIHKKLHKN